MYKYLNCNIIQFKQLVKTSKILINQKVKVHQGLIKRDRERGEGEEVERRGGVKKS